MQLHSPLHINSMQVKNRIVMAPCSTNYPAPDGSITPELIHYYKERASGGTGLIIIENTNIDYPLGKSGYTQFRIDNDTFLPGLHELVEIIHEYQSKVGIQLNHSGGTFGDRGMEESLPLAPSALEYGAHRKMAKEMGVPEIKAVVNKFIDGAIRAKRCGFDCIELHGAHGYLLSQFLSPWTNQRNDMYGGSTKNRAKIAVDIVKGIRNELGQHYPIIFRINGEEFVDEGLSKEESLEICYHLKEAGVDCFHVSAGSRRFPELPARRAVVEPMSYPQGWKVYLAEYIKKNTGLPVITVGVIRDPEFAEQVIGDNKTDFVALGRGLIAEPDWAKKSKNNELIRKCISCNECSYHRSQLGWKLRCSVNPFAGREYRLDQKLSVDNAKNIAVIGGGPAGLQFAQTASQKGHEVTIFERNSGLGGNLLPAGRVTSKKKIHWLRDYLVHCVEQSNVTYQLGFEVTSSGVLKDFDSIIFASGSSPCQKEPFSEGPYSDVNPVLQAVDLLKEPEKYKPILKHHKRILVLGGGLVGCETALFLKELGYTSEIITRQQKKNLLSNLEAINRFETLEMLHKEGIAIFESSRVIRDKNTYFMHNSETVAKVPSDCLFVLAQGMQSVLPPVKTFDLQGKEVHYIGDCVKPRNIISAIYEGFITAHRI